jgi:ribosomal protein S18 acetylase RimI-like enzyme
VTRLPDELIAFWRALDEQLDRVSPTPWGAVVSDARFPSIWDANYARVDGRVENLRLRDVEEALVPELERVGGSTFHVVSFLPEETGELFAELSGLGHVLSWDVAMRFEGAPGRDPSVIRVEPIRPGPELRAAVAATFPLFEIADPEVIRQLSAIEDLLVERGAKRWFGVRDEGAWASVAALVELAGVAYVDNVATLPRARGRGYASAVTAHLRDEALTAGARAVYLLAEPAGPIALYARLGFREIGRIGSTRGPIPGR